jgi:hypothetical protein
MTQPQLGFLVTLTLLGLARTMSVHAQATTTVERFTDTFVFDDVNPCNGEAVTLTGELNITIRTTVDSQGKTHVAFTLVPSAVRGEGESGTSYKAVGGQREHFNSIDNAPPIDDTFTETFNLIGQGSTDNLEAHVIFHITIAADGTVKSEVERVRAECRG